MRTLTLGARAFIPMALAGAVILTFAPGTSGSVAAAEPTTEAQQIIQIARAQVGDPWRYATQGPRAFDCSGLVIYSYTKAGEAGVIGKGQVRSARGLYASFKSRGLASRSNPKPGDLVIWGGGTHVGIYIGNGKAVSTLTSGVRVHGVHAVRASFTAYLHTGMWKRSTTGEAAPATVAPASTPTATTAAVTTTASTTVSTRIAIDSVRRADGQVNLRRRPGIAGALITTLRDNARLQVLAKAQDSRGRWWLKVQTGTHTGWVARWLTD